MTSPKLPWRRAMPTVRAPPTASGTHIGGRSLATSSPTCDVPRKSICLLGCHNGARTTMLRLAASNSRRERGWWMGSLEIQILPALSCMFMRSSSSSYFCDDGCGSSEGPQSVLWIRCLSEACLVVSLRAQADYGAQLSPRPDRAQVLDEFVRVQEGKTS